MELKNGREIEKLNAKIEELKERLNGATVEESHDIEEQIFSLEARRDQMLAFVEQNTEEIEEDDF